MPCIGSPSSLQTCDTPPPPHRAGWLPQVGDGSPASPTPAARLRNYTTISLNGKILKLPVRRTFLDIVQECEVEEDVKYADDDKAFAEGLRRSLDAGRTLVENVQRNHINKDVYKDDRDFAQLRIDGAVTPENLRREMDAEEGGSSSAIDEPIFGNGSRDKGKGKTK